MLHSVLNSLSPSPWWHSFWLWRSTFQFKFPSHLLTLLMWLLCYNVVSLSHFIHCKIPNKYVFILNWVELSSSSSEIMKLREERKTMPRKCPVIYSRSHNLLGAEVGLEPGFLILGLSNTVFGSMAVYLQRLNLSSALTYPALIRN